MTSTSSVIDLVIAENEYLNHLNIELFQSPSGSTRVRTLTELKIQTQLNLVSNQYIIHLNIHYFKLRQGPQSGGP